MFNFQITFILTKKLKLFAVVLGVSVAVGVSVIQSKASGFTIKVGGCFGDDSQKCYTDADGKTFYGKWRELTLKKLPEKGNEGPGH